MDKYKGKINYAPVCSHLADFILKHIGSEPNNTLEIASGEGILASMINEKAGEKVVIATDNKSDTPRIVEIRDSKEAIEEYNDKVTNLLMAYPYNPSEYNDDENDPFDQDAVHKFRSASTDGLIKKMNRKFIYIGNYEVIPKWGYGKEPDYDKEYKCGMHESTASRQLINELNGCWDAEDKFVLGYGSIDTLVLCVVYKLKEDKEIRNFDFTQDFKKLDNYNQELAFAKMTTQQRNDLGINRINKMMLMHKILEYLESGNIKLEDVKDLNLDSVRVFYPSIDDNTQFAKIFLDGKSNGENSNKENSNAGNSNKGNSLNANNDNANNDNANNDIVLEPNAITSNSNIENNNQKGGRKRKTSKNKLTRRGKKSKAKKTLKKKKTLKRKKSLQRK